jgi:hypothetical protein
LSTQAAEAAGLNPQLLYPGYATEKKTSWANLAASITCAKLCIKDHSLPGKIDYLTLKKISLTAAEIGNVKVLGWAFQND